MAIINGTNGDDNFANSLFGTIEDDQIFGFAGNDFLFGSAGNDMLDGGADYDVALYAGGLFDATGVFINNTGSTVTALWNGVSTTALANTVLKSSGTDTLIDIESFNATDGNDVVYLGDPLGGGSYVFDLGGNDLLVADQTSGAGFAVFYAGSGNDTFQGSIGNVDVLDYERGATIDGAGPQTQGILLNYTGVDSGTVIDPWGGTDTFTEIESVYGSDLDDTMNGGAGNDFLYGNGGNDILNGNAGFDRLSGDAGNDTLNGGTENDTAVYSRDPSGVFVDLRFGTATDGYGNFDTLTSIENVEGSDYFDNIIGDGANNLLSGGGDTDWLSASAGNDTMDGGDGADLIFYSGYGLTNGVTINNTDTAIGAVAAFTTDKRGFGTDTLISIENFHGTDFDDEIYVGGQGGTYTFDQAGNDLVVASQDRNAGDDHFFATGSGNDTLVGTVQRDRVDYSADGETRTQGVDVDLAAGIATDAWGDTDTLTSIERVTGTNFNDTLLGNDDRNDFNGLQGDDLIDGRGGDRDRAEYQNDPNGVTVDLELGLATDGWGTTDTLLSIENIRGSEFGDTLRGDDLDNSIEGEAGDDLIEGRGGDDFLEGDAGADTLDGGEGFDVIGHFDDPTGVLVDLASGTATDGWGDTDTLISIEGVDGSEHGDTLRGDDGDNFLDGREGDDLLEGRGGDFDNFRGSQGNDTIDGGAGTDRVEYHRDAERGGTNAVFVDLAAGTATDGFGDTDTLISIEEVRATDGDDTLIGNAENNRFQPGEGSDSMDGGAQTGTFSQGDEIDYSRLDSGPVTVTFTDDGIGTTQKTGGAVDTFTGIEEIFGTRFDDLITGNNGDEWLGGEGGNDTIIGGDGNDDLSGGDGDDSLDGGVGGDFLQPGAGNDIIIGGANGPLFEEDELSYGFDRDATTGVNVTFTSEFDGSVLDWSGGTDSFTGIERVRGTSFDDTFTGAEGDQEFRGLGGDDLFDGGAGEGDRVDYSRADDDTGAFQGINVSLDAGGGTDANGDTDTFIGIEEIRGSRWDDTIIGDANRNDLQGEDGNDLIDSFGGADNNMQGGRGNDTIEARGDNDWASGGDGNDLITFYGVGGGANPGLGSDTIVGGTEGFFSLDYNGVGESVVIDTALGTTQLTGGDVDTFTNIRNIGGGDGDDTLLGDDNEEFQRFRTSLGDDFIDGRGGFDELEYDDRNETSVVVDFVNGTVTGTYTGTDTFVNIESVRGSNGADTFIGNDQDNQFRGMDGADTYSGGDGFDSLNFSGERFNGGTQAIDIDLEAGTTNDGWGNAETFTGIERVVATDSDDTMAGSSGADRLIGILGDDILDGRDGDDGLYAGGGADTVTGGAGTDRFGGRVWELDGDTFTDFGAEDILQVFDENFNLIGANTSIVGNQLLIDTTGDGIAEATVTLSNGYTGPVNNEGGPVGGPVPASFSVQDAGLFTAVVDEDAGTANVTIIRSGDIFSTATVDITITGTGLNPVDGSDVSVPFSVPVTLTFTPGTEQLIYQIGIVDDLLVESVEDLAFTLSNPTSDGAAGAEIAEGQTFVRILDNDVAPTVNITGEKAQEDSGVITFTVTRTGDTSQAITVDYDIRSAGGLQAAESDDLVDGLPQSGSVVIEAGAAEATFSLAIAVDAEAELHDDIIARISPTADWPAGLEVGVAQATGSIRNDDGVPPVLPAGATGANYGDPHIITLDGLAYDFQAVGEFTLIEAVSGDPLDIQVRFQPVEGSQVASQTTAVATTVGAARVMIDATGSSLVTVDGAAFDIQTAIGGTTLGDGEIYFDGEAITLVYANGEQLRVDVFDGFLSTSVSIASGRDVRGLLGNADGDTANDLALRDGTVLSQPIAFADLYGDFAADWRISETTSLFDYPAGQGTADFTDLSFPVAQISIDDFPIEILAEAEQAAAGITDPVLREDAILDYLLSGNADFIEAASVIAGGEGGALTETAIVGAPPVLQGVGISASETTLFEGNSGSQTVVFTVYRTGDISSGLSLDYQVGGDVDASDYAGQGSGSLVFDAGERTQTITLDVLGDLLAEADETLELSFAVSAGSPTVLSSVASVVIANDDLAPVAQDDAFRTDEDTGLLGNVFADNGSGSDSDDQPLQVTALSGPGGPLVVGSENDLGNGASITLDADGSLSFDPGQAYQSLNDGETAELSFTYTIGDGAQQDSGQITITIDGITDAPPEVNIITGTDGSDFLIGTEGADRIISLGGRYDIMFGGEGGDQFVFGAETLDRKKSTDVILDYEAGIDALLLVDGAAITSVEETWLGLSVAFEDSKDTLLIFGNDLVADDLIILTDSPA